MTSDLRGQLLANEELSKYTSWRVGGCAELMFIPADKEDLCLYVSQLAGTKELFWMGLGSNLLVRDGGINGVVINTRGRLKQMYVASNDDIVVEAGVPCAHVARFSAEQGRVGAEFLAGIPGTMGGALRMNAGAFGGSTWDLVKQVETIDRLGVVRIRQADEFVIHYRGIEGIENEWFLAAHLDIAQGNGTESQEKIKTLLARRNQTQPTNQPSCGSVFKNPEGDYAARLIEACNLKGYCIGGACISEKHANFIVNTGNATAAEIEALIEYIQKQVQHKFGITLQTEVCRVGNVK